MLSKYYQRCVKVVDYPSMPSHSWMFTSQYTKERLFRVGGLDPILNNLPQSGRGYKHFIQRFIETHKTVLIAPCIFGRLIGYFVKDVSSHLFRIYTATRVKLYSTYEACKKFPYVYGKPFLLSEGPKDANVLSYFYPYSFSYLGGAVSGDTAEFISMMTNKVILAPDMDDAGDRGYKVSLSNFRKNNVSVSKLDLPFKDPGVAIENLIKGDPTGMDYLRGLVNSALSIY